MTSFSMTSLRVKIRDSYEISSFTSFNSATLPAVVAWKQCVDSVHLQRAANCHLVPFLLRTILHSPIASFKAFWERASLQVKHHFRY